MKALIIGAAAALVVTAILVLNQEQKPMDQVVILTKEPSQQMQKLQAEISTRLSSLENIQKDLAELKTQSSSLQFYNKDNMVRLEDRFWDKYRHQAALKSYQTMLDKADQLKYNARSLHSSIPVTFECDRNYFQR